MEESGRCEDVTQGWYAQGEKQTEGEVLASSLTEGARMSPLPE